MNNEELTALSLFNLNSGLLLAKSRCTILLH